LPLRKTDRRYTTVLYRIGSRQRVVPIMNHHARRLGVLLSPLLLLAACGPSHHTQRVLGDRLYTQLAPDIVAGKAVLQPLPDGDQVTLLDPSMFPNDIRALSDAYPDIRANVIEAMLDPSLMQVQITDTAPLREDLRDARVRNVAQYFVDNGLASTLVPPSQPPAAAAPAGLTITITLRCPDRHGGSGYGDGRSHPVCD
jgi:hypothetical protein